MGGSAGAGLEVLDHCPFDNFVAAGFSTKTCDMVSLPKSADITAFRTKCTS